MNVLDKYYNENRKHKYMDVDNSDVLIFDYLRSLNLNNAIVLEIGAGFGRYTKALTLVAKKVISVEPNSFMYKQLKQNLKNIENLLLIQTNLEQLITKKISQKVDYVFMFHVLHHLPLEIFAKIKQLIDKLGATLIIIEPNHLNPLFLIQIFFTRDMKFKEEKRMLIDNSKILIKQYFNNKYLIRRKFTGFFPRNMTNLLSKKYKFFSDSSFFSIGFKNPFSAYSILKIY